MGDASVITYTDPHVTISSDSTVSSSLPAFPMPQLLSSVETLPEPPPPVTRPSPPDQARSNESPTHTPTAPIQNFPSAPSSNFTSVSDCLPARILQDCSPPPLANVSMSEVRSTLSTDCLSYHNARHPSIPVTHQARALLQANGFPVSRRRRRLSGSGCYDAMFRVAQRLVQGNDHNGQVVGPDVPKGSKDDLLVVDEDTSDENSSVVTIL